MTLNAGAATSVSVAPTVPDGYVYAGVVGWQASEWHMAVSKATCLSNGTVSINVVNAGNAQYTSSVAVEVLFIPVA